MKDLASDSYKPFFCCTYLIQVNLFIAHGSVTDAGRQYLKKGGCKHSKEVTEITTVLGRDRTRHVVINADCHRKKNRRGKP